jgi:inosose dehydratase
VKLAFSQATSDEGAEVLMRRFVEFGYEGLQLKAGQYAPFLDDGPAFLARYGTARGGVASALIAGGQLDEPGITHLRQVIAFAATVGSERVVFCHGKPRTQVKAGDHRRHARVLSALGQEAQDRGVALSLHHHFNQPVMRRDDFAPFFDAVDAGRVGLTIDTAHLVKSGVEDVGGVIREWAHVIDNFHLKDIDADGQFRVLGQGRIEFAPIFEAIRSIGYDGWVSADEESGADVVEAMRTCHSFLTAALFKDAFTIPLKTEMTRVELQE